MLLSKHFNREFTYDDFPGQKIIIDIEVGQLSMMKRDSFMEKIIDQLDQCDPATIKILSNGEVSPANIEKIFSIRNKKGVSRLAELMNEMMLGCIVDMTITAIRANGTETIKGANLETFGELTVDQAEWVIECAKEVNPHLLKPTEKKTNGSLN